MANPHWHLNDSTTEKQNAIHLSFRHSGVPSRPINTPASGTEHLLRAVPYV
jgi:hypothetical protein